MFEIFINFYQAALITYYVNKCCSLRAHALWKDFLLVLLVGITICGIDVVPIYPFDDLIFLIPICYSIYYRQNKVITTIFWCFILIMIFSIDSTLSSGLITLLTNATWDEMLVKSDVRTLYVISANVLHTFIIAFLATLTEKHHTIYPGGAVCLLLSMGVQLAVAECLFVIRIQSTTSMPLTIYGSLGMLVSMILTIALHEILIKQSERQKDLEVESQMNLLISEHQEELRTIYANMLSTQHDLRHRITTAEQMLMNQQDKSPSVIAELLKDTDVLQEYITGNVSVDAILASKTGIMRKSDIHFSFYPTPLDRLPLSEQQFSIILANILDNAIEGIMRLPSGAGPREIKLIFSRNWDIFSVICENDMNPETISIKDGDFVSSKQEPFMHGFGTRSVRKIVEDAGGIIDYSTEDKKFVVRIILPMGDQPC